MGNLLTGREGRIIELCRQRVVQMASALEQAKEADPDLDEHTLVAMSVGDAETIFMVLTELYNTLLEEGITDFKVNKTFINAKVH